MASYADYANTERQAEIGKMMDSGHSSRQIADKIGIDSGYTRKQMRILKARSAKKERGQHITETPEGFGIKKTSTAYNKDGDVAFQWVIRTQDEQRQVELLKEAITALCDDLPKLPRTQRPSHTDPALLAVYPLGDPHIGVLAWAEETGQDWDLGIADEKFCGAFDRLVHTAPHAMKPLLLTLATTSPATTWKA